MSNLITNWMGLKHELLSVLQLKIMLSLSWIIPASLWIPMVFAWYSVTGETRPPPDQCNVPFTHHTIFNTVLTVTYFWIPLCFMISLYVGIYRVAAGLQRKAASPPKGLTDLVLMAGTTMSKIGLSVKIKYENGEACGNTGEKNTAQTDCISSGMKDLKTISKPE